MFCAVKRTDVYFRALLRYIVSRAAANRKKTEGKLFWFWKSKRDDFLSALVTVICSKSIDRIIVFISRATSIGKVQQSVAQPFERARESN